MAFTIAAKVRALLPTLLIDDDDLGVSNSGTHLELNYPAYAVPTILIDGVSSTAFTFTRPDKIALTSAAAGERFIAQVHRGVADAALDGLITTSDREIRAIFTGQDLPAEGYLEDWSTILSAVSYLRLYCSATEENLDKTEALEKSVRDSMELHIEKVSANTESAVIKVNS